VQLLSEMLPCASTDETRYILNGVCLDLAKETKIPQVVATDGRRLSKTALNADKVFAHGRHILPTLCAEALVSGLPEDAKVEVRAEPENVRRLLVRSEASGFRYMAVLKVVDGNYPNYSQVIPKGTRPEFVIDREEFLAALARIMVLTNVDASSVKFTFNPKGLRLNSCRPDMGEGVESVSVKTNHEKEIIVAINPDFIDQILKAWSDEKILVNALDAVSPITLSAGDKLAIIMPVRLS